MLQHFQRLAVGHLGHAIGDSGHAIMQVHLPRGDVNRVVMLLAETIAAGGEHEKAHRSQRQDRSLQAPRERDESNGEDAYAQPVAVTLRIAEWGSGINWPA